MPGTPRKKASIAGPRGKKAAAQKLPQGELDRMQGIICASLEDDKAEDILAIDLAGRASFADRMVLATGLADRQISAMATHLTEKLHEAGFKKILIEGAAGTDWVLIDAGDIIVQGGSAQPVRFGENVGPGSGRAGGGSGSVSVSKEALLFLKKKKQKDFFHLGLGTWDIPAASSNGGIRRVTWAILSVRIRCACSP
jgi:ribosome-associated protein